MFGVVVIATILVLCFLSPYILKYDYAKIDILHACAKPSLEHPFGCDEVGRDILARVLYGARYTLSIGVLSTALAATVGITLGSIAGFFGGLTDSFIMRALDVIQAFPQLLMAMTLAAILGTGLDKCILALGISMIAGYARMTRANILNIRNSEYIEAATSIKCSTLRIIFKHILPNVLSPLIIQAAIGIASSGLSASALSFIGLGIQAPKPEWGSMLSTARSYIRENPHMVFFPGLFIMLTVLSLNLIGDALRDILDPKLKE
jgi:ABC-type dipeptide/oligopeptide/nickel transport system permease subunit